MHFFLDTLRVKLLYSNYAVSLKKLTDFSVLNMQHSGDWVVVVACLLLILRPNGV